MEKVKYSKEDVFRETLNYFNGDELATNVWIDKYCLKDKEDNLLEIAPFETHIRLAEEFTRIENKYTNPLSFNEIFDLLDRFKYIIPGGSILYGVGNNYSITSLGNCFVIGNKYDSYGSILTTDREQAELMKRRAGVGHDLSHLRPEGAKVSNSAGTSTGAVSFMHRYSNTTREVGQDGRRGALMLSMDINHPNINKFIESKDDLTKITGANISVKVDDEFMKCVGDKREEFNEINNTWNKLIHQAWKSAEPGVLFWDKIKSESIPSCYGKEWEETSTNPCGEIPLCPYDSCRLLSVNLYSFVENPFTDKAYFNYNKFKDAVYKAQRLMDDVVDLEEEKINNILIKIGHDPEPVEIKQIEINLWLKIKKKLLEGRRTGLSAIGLADVFAALNIQYGSEESIDLAEEIYKQFAITAYKSSIDMAKERGPFPMFDYNRELMNPFLKRIDEEFSDYLLQGKDSSYRKSHVQNGRRNIALLTIPPSGSISILAGISSGIEPVYQLYYKRRRKINPGENKKVDFVDQNGDSWEEYYVIHPRFVQWALSKNNGNTKEFLSTLDSKTLSELQNLSPYSQSTSYEIDPIQRVKLQAKIQKWIDHSISSTINLPETITEEEVSNIYLEAWKQGCKGITIYRNNSRTGVLVDVEKKEENHFNQHNAPKRPSVLLADIKTTVAKGEQWLVIVGLYEGKPYEVFALPTFRSNLDIRGKYAGEIIKKSKGQYDLNIRDISIIENFTDLMSDNENMLTRMISTALRHGSDIKYIVEQLNKSKGDITSFSKAIARTLKTYIKDGESVRVSCPECGNELIYKDGCEQCSVCTYSKCG